MKFEAVIIFEDVSEMNVHFTAVSMTAALMMVGQFFPNASQVHVKNLS